MNKLWNLASVASVASLAGVLLLGGARDAQAVTQININGSTSGSFTFTGVPPNSLHVTSTVINGTANFNGGPNGTYSFGATTFNTLGENNQGQYVAIQPALQSFVFNSGAEHLDGTVTWLMITDGSNTPRFNGNLAINLATLAGDPFFLSTFATGQGAIDITVGPLGAILSSLNGTTGTLTSGISSGEAFPTPLPPALALFLSGLVGLWATARRRRKVQPAFS